MATVAQNPSLVLRVSQSIALPTVLAVLIACDAFINGVALWQVKRQSC